MTKSGKLDASTQLLLDRASKQCRGRTIDLVKTLLASIRGIDVDSLPRSGVGEVSAAEATALQQLAPRLLENAFAELKIKDAA
jgi:hypothetical protein